MKPEIPPMTPPTTNIEIMRTFVRVRTLAAAHGELAKRLSQLEQATEALAMSHDTLNRSTGVQFKKVFDALRALMVNMDPFEFYAQFQQLPRLAVGEFLDDNDLGIVEKAPDGLKWVRYVDLALGESRTSDFNSTLAVAFADDGTLYIRDRIKERNLDAFLPMIKTAMLSEQERHVVWGFESVAFQKLVLKEFRRDSALANVAMREEKPLGDKVERARPWQLRAKGGKVKLVRGAWNISFIREATAFPKGRHDDDVDSVSGGVQMLSTPKRKSMVG